MKIFINKYIVLLCIFTLFAEHVYAESFADIMYQHSGYIWTPLDDLKMVGSTDEKLLEEVYYCKDQNIRDVYYKKFVEEQSATLKAAGLSGSLSDSDQKCQEALERGKCKLVKTVKTLQKKNYRCVGLFGPNDEFLDIQICNTTPEAYKQQKAKGITHDQMENFFDKIEDKLMKEFILDKAK